MDHAKASLGNASTSRVTEAKADESFFAAMYDNAMETYAFKHRGQAVTASRAIEAAVSGLLYEL